MKRQEQIKTRHIKKQFFLIHSELTDKVAWDGHKESLKKKKKGKIGRCLFLKNKVKKKIMQC